MRRFPFYLLLFLLSVVQLCAQQATKDWSADMLEQLLGSPAPSSAIPNSRPSEGPKSSGLPADGTVLVVRQYQLRFQQVGAPEFTTKLKVLEQLIPAGGIIKEDPPSNSVSVMTSPRVQEAVFAYLSAIDTQPAPSTMEIPPEVQKAIKQMAASSEETAKQIQKITQMNMSEVNQKLSVIADQNKKQMWWYAGTGLSVAVVLIVLFWVTQNKSKGNQDSQSLALIPTQQAIERIESNQQTEREEVVALLHTVMKKMNADRLVQANLHQKVIDSQLLMAESKIQLQELVQERETVMRQAGDLLNKAVSEFGEKSEILQTEQSRVQALAEQLQETIRELDLTRDQLGQKEVDLNKARYELEHEKAKIAAVSILMEEGKLPPGTLPSFGAVLPPTGTSDAPFEASEAAGPANDGAEATPASSAAEPVSAPVESHIPPDDGSGSKPTFKFLPPDP